MSRPHPERWAVLAAPVLPLAAAAALVPFRPSFPNTDAALVLVTVVVVIAATGSRIAGLIAAASAAVWFDFFLTEPYEHFTITHRADIETTVLLLVVGAAVTEIAARGRMHRTVAAVDEAYLGAIRDTTEAVASGAEPDDVVASVRACLVDLLGLRGIRFERHEFGGMPRLEPDGSVHTGEATWDVDAQGWPGRPVELLASSNGRAYGRFVLDGEQGARPPAAARRVAAILAGQVGLALAGHTHARR